MSDVYYVPLITERGEFLLTESGEQLTTETEQEIAESAPTGPGGAYNGVKNFIMRRLGYPRVKVYMAEEQLDDCIWLAINRYFEYRGDETNLKTHNLNAASGQNDFDIPVFIVPEYIHEVLFKPSDPLLSMTGVMQDVYILYYLQNAGGASNFIVDYWMTLASYEEYTRVLGNQPHWEILNGKIRVYPTPSIGYNLAIKYMDLPSETTIENIRWIREYSLAQAKQVEGEIRSKFSSFSAGSGDISLNGDALKSESQIEIEKLELYLFERQIPLGFTTG